MDPSLRDHSGPLRGDLPPGRTPPRSLKEACPPPTSESGGGIWNLRKLKIFHQRVGQDFFNSWATKYVYWSAVVFSPARDRNISNSLPAGSHHAPCSTFEPIIDVHIVAPLKVVFIAPAHRFSGRRRDPHHPSGGREERSWMGVGGTSGPSQRPPAAPTRPVDGNPTAHGPPFQVYRGISDTGKMRITKHHNFSEFVNLKLFSSTNSDPPQTYEFGNTHRQLRQSIARRMKYVTTTQSLFQTQSKRDKSETFAWCCDSPFEIKYSYCFQFSIRGTFEDRSHLSQFYKETPLTSIFYFQHTSSKDTAGPCEWWSTGAFSAPHPQLPRLNRGRRNGCQSLFNNEAK